MGLVYDAIGGIITALAPLLVANGGDVVTIERGIRTWDEVDLAERPYIGVETIGDKAGNHVNRVYDVDMDVKIVAHVTGGDPDTRSEELDAMRDAIKGELGLDPTLDGLITAILYTGSIGDQADPIQRQHGTIELTFRAEFQERI